MAQFRDVTLPYLSRLTDPEAFDIGRELAQAMAIGSQLAAVRMNARGQALAQINAGREMDMAEKHQRQDLELTRQAMELDGTKFEITRKQGELNYTIDRRKLQLLEKEAERDARLSDMYLESINDAMSSMDDGAPPVEFDFSDPATIGADTVLGGGKKKEVTEPSGGFEFKPTAGNFNVLDKTRDQIDGFSSREGRRMISLDFNDTSSGGFARGIEIRVPDDATSNEKDAARKWAKRTQQLFASKGLEVPLRHGDGVKTSGRGVSGVFHTEPFFAGDPDARDILQNNSKEYARILSETLGALPGTTFIPPHKSTDGGAESDGINERDFARKYLIPNLNA